MPKGKAAMRRTLKITAAIVVSAGLLSTSTVVVAAAPAATAPVQAQPQAPDAWMMLSAMSSTRAVALGGAAAAAQPANVPPSPPPGYYVRHAAINGEIIGVLVWFALIAIALGISGSNGRPTSPT